MSNEADEITAEYKKLRSRGQLGDNSQSITDRLWDSLSGAKKKREDAERIKKYKDDADAEVKKMLGE